MGFFKTCWCPDVNAGTSQVSSLIITVYSRQHIGLPLYHYSNWCWKYNNISDRVVVSRDVYSDAGEILFAIIPADVDVLADEGISYIRFVAILGGNASGSEMRNVTIVHCGSYWIYNGNAATPKIGVQHKLLQSNVFV